MLALELTDLRVLGADLERLGFTADELAKALNPPGTTGLTDEDEVPELAEKAVSHLGDIWLAGPHRIACGIVRTALRSQHSWLAKVPTSW